MVREALAVLAAGLVLGAVVQVASAQLTPEDIEALRVQGELEGWTFTVAENEATRRPAEVLLGYTRPEVWPEIPPVDESLGTARDRVLPAYFDWRVVDPNGGCTPIRDQLDCGACWAFTAIGAVESAILRLRGQSTDLSEQWLISCTGAGSCSGGQHYNALWALTCNSLYYRDSCGDSGPVMEVDFPYIAANGTCACPYTHPPEYCITGWTPVGSLVSVPPTANIKQAIIDHGPVTCSVYASNSFMAYDGGIFNNCQNSPTNHTVVIIGWNDAQGCWIIRNSWGTTWGEGGYGRILYNCSRIGEGACYVRYPAWHDCNNNGVNDVDDIAGGTSQDCNSNDVPDECDVLPNPPLIAQTRNNDYVLAQDFTDAGYAILNIKEWDDFTVDEPVQLVQGYAYFRPETWGGYGTVPFLVEIADVPGGAEAGGNVLLSTTGTGASGGLVTWDFGGATLPAGTYWLSVQATGGFIQHGMVYWYRANNILVNGSEHYYHNPGGGQGHGTVPAPGSTWWTLPADLAFTQHYVADFDTNGNGIPDECEFTLCPGDANCDASINWRDIDYFVAAMNDNVAAWVALFAPGAPTCNFGNNDANGDGGVNWRDIDAFVALMNTPCP